MSLADEYRSQSRWRPWARIFSVLPPIDGHRVLDLGCALGDQAAEMAGRGAHVVGVDANEELLHVARSRDLPHAVFERRDLRALGDLGEPFDGVWCSFTAGYVPRLADTLASWLEHVKPGGWTAFTEVDDLFGHEPLPPGVKALFSGYAEDALGAGRFDFHMGSKLAGHLERAGVEVVSHFTVEDRELSFSGPAEESVIDAWRLRFARMPVLETFCGAAFSTLREEFLACLKRSDHSSVASVHVVFGYRRP
jgi:SAM-dependent methyltransferase